MSNGAPSRIRLPGSTLFVLVALTVLTAALFWVASTVEKREVHSPVSVGTPAAAEGSPARESEEATSRESESPVLGVNLETPWVPYAVIIASGILIVLLILLGYPILFVVVLIAVAGTILDVRELIHQMAAARVGLSFLVLGVALTRVATVAVSLAAILSRNRRPSAA